jgi:hypothetical protein
LVMYPHHHHHHPDIFGTIPLMEMFHPYWKLLKPQPTLHRVKDENGDWPWHRVHRLLLLRQDWWMGYEERLQLSQKLQCKRRRLSKKKVGESKFMIFIQMKCYC